jgi:hypothetical protein
MKEAAKDGTPLKPACPTGINSIMVILQLFCKLSTYSPIGIK